MTKGSTSAWYLFLDAARHLFVIFLRGIIWDNVMHEHRWDDEVGSGRKLWVFICLHQTPPQIAAFCKSKRKYDLETGSSTSFLIFPPEKWQDFAQCWVQCWVKVYSLSEDRVPQNSRSRLPTCLTKPIVNVSYGFLLVACRQNLSFTPIVHHSFGGNFRHPPRAGFAVPQVLTTHSFRPWRVLRQLLWRIGFLRS